MFFEISGALLVANYFKTDVVFLRLTPLKSPDFIVKNETWELKSPGGNSKNTIYNVFLLPLVNNHTI